MEIKETEYEPIIVSANQTMNIIHGGPALWEIVIGQTNVDQPEMCRGVRLTSTTPDPEFGFDPLYS